MQEDQGIRPLRPWEKFFVGLVLNVFMVLSALSVLVSITEVSMHGGLSWLQFFASTGILWCVVQMRPRHDPVKRWVQDVIVRRL